MKRFSLRTTLIVLFLVGLSLGYVLLLIQNISLQREVEMLRGESGHLTVVDDSLVNVVEVPTESEITWRWRVYAPEGTYFDAGIATDAIPQTGAPPAGLRDFQIPTDPKGVLVTASVTNDIDGGYVLKLTFGDRSTYSDRTQLPREEFFDGSANQETAGRGGTVAYPYDQPIVLHRRRLHEQTSPTTRAAPVGDARGMMFWITPRKKP